jgi:hypothetical protein
MRRLSLPPLRLAALGVAVSAGAVVPAAVGAGSHAAAAGSASSYSLIHDYDAYTRSSVLVRWAPCRRTSSGVSTHYISYRINTAGVSSRVTLVKRAIARLSSRTGLHFRYLGRTSYIPHNAVLHYPTGNQQIFNAAQQRSATHAELVVAWAYKKSSNMLTGTEDGVGTISWRSSYHSQNRILEGAVVMKRGVSLRAGFVAGSSVGALLLHELGHAVGLRHVGDTSQIMFPTLASYSPGAYAAGDRTGLHKVGSAAGCLSTAPLAPTDPVAIAAGAGVSVTR